MQTASLSLIHLVLASSISGQAARFENRAILWKVASVVKTIFRSQ